MKIAVRVFTMLVVFAGLALASVSSANNKAMANQSSVNFMDPGPMGLPVPQCGPGIPGCKNPPPPSLVGGGTLAF